MGHKYVQLFQYPLKGTELSGKTETISALGEYISDNIDSFRNGEEITVRFRDTVGNILSAVAIINIIEGEISISLGLTERETKRIVESDEEPIDDDVLWLKESESGITPEEIKTNLNRIEGLIASLSEIVSRHEFAFTRVMNCGDIETNSTRKDLMDTAAPIKPDILENDNTDNIEPEAPDYENYEEPNVRSICIKGAASEAAIKAHVKDINERELILCESNLTLYTVLTINGTKSLIKISGGGGGGGSETGSTEDIMSGITQSGDSISSIRFISSNGKKYIVKVDEYGKLITYNADYDNLHTAPTSGTPGQYGPDGYVFEERLYINSLYCGGTDEELGQEVNEHSINYCSHNFVELSNLTGHDINLSGLSLQYSIGGAEWEVLPLRGIIKNGGTFLIRGAQCSVLDANTTKIKVDTFDMEWNIEQTIGGVKVKRPIQFSNKACKFYLTYGIESCDVTSPYANDTTEGTYKGLYGYIDFLGMDNNKNEIDASEKKPFRKLNSNNLFVKYYTMDDASQANKVLSGRSNANDMQYVNLSNDDILPSIEVYKPKASFEHKNIFYNKTDLVDGAPNMITCSFGIQATDNGDGATRCFNWVSKGYYDEALWVWNVSDGGKTLVYSGVSVNGEAYRDSEGNINPNYFYNRIVQENTNGTFFTTHKAIVRGLSSGTYSYSAGKYEKSGSNLIPKEGQCTKEKIFVVKSDAEIKDGFKFVQVSDQQGFNWDEYQMWKYAAREINKENTSESAIEFVMNTGDMAQSGNRMNEWLDYFDAKDDYLSYLAEVATIGNNDQCPDNIYIQTDGSAKTKINPANILLYYTFELDTDNLPVFDVTIKGETTSDIYIPSLYSFNFGKVHFICVNSEIATETEQFVFKIKNADIYQGSTYEAMEKWIQYDINKAKQQPIWVETTSSATSEWKTVSILPDAHSYKPGEDYIRLIVGDDAFKYYKKSEQNPYEWIIAYCHEMPFTIITDGAINDYYDKDKSEERTENNRLGSHLNTVAADGHTFWFSQLCQNNGIRLVLGGHKHTQAITWPLKENVVVNPDGTKVVKSFKPVIQITKEELKNFFGGNALCTIDRAEAVHEGLLMGNSYPDNWFDWSYVEMEYSSTIVYTDVAEMPAPSYNSEKYIHNTTDGKYYRLRKMINDTYNINSHFSTFELTGNGGTDVPTYPIYAMSQSSGYKHTSNKELPAASLPWEHYYFPNNKGAANVGQKYPFYTIWNFIFDTSETQTGTTQIIGNVKKVAGLFNKDGKFNINVEGENAKNNISSWPSEYPEIKAVNGIGAGKETETDVLIINKQKTN